MGGAFAGLANDPSATYYNPAGLPRLDDVSIAASLTLNAFDRQKIINGFRSGDEATDLQHTTRPSLPVFASFVKQLGWREGDARRHAVGFSTMIVDRRTIGFDASIESGPIEQRKVDTLTLADERTVRWYGLSYGYRISREWSVGLSTFISANSMSHAEERLNLTLIDYVGDNVYANSIVSLHSTRARFNVKNGIFRLGVLYAMSARLRFGAMFQPPSFRIKGSAYVRDRIVDAAATSDQQGANYYFGKQGGLNSHDPAPWELRLGVSWAPNYDLLLALDVSAYGKRGSKDDPVVAIGPREITPGTKRAPQPGDLVLQEWYGKRTGNVAAGMEYRIKNVVMVRSGFFTDLSGAPKLPKVSNVYLPSDIDRVGATLSAGLITRGYDVSLGVAATFGWGKTQAFVVDDPEARYVRTRVQEQTLFVFLSGARSAAGKLAADTYEMLKEKMKDDDEEKGD